MLATLRAAFPDQGWRIRDPHDAAPGVTRFIDQTSLFLTLVGLTSLLVGGIGVANGVRAWLDARARTIATLRCLGASSRLVLRGLPDPGAGAGACRHRRRRGRSAPPLPLALAALAQATCCRCRRSSGIYPGPLALAAGYGLLTALAFSLWPLGRAARIPGAALFRDALLPERTPPAARSDRGQLRVVALALVGADRRRPRPTAGSRCGSAPPPLATLAAVPARRLRW